MADDRRLRARTGLRLRFVVVLTVVVGVIGAGFLVAAMVIIEELEAELLDRRIDYELREFVVAYEYDPDIPLLTWGGLERYAAPGGDHAAVPEPLQQLEAGAVERLRVKDRHVIASRADVGDDRLFVTIEVAPVQQLERRVRTRLIAILLAAVALAAVVGVGLATAVTRPVAALARAVAALQPPHTMRGIAHGAHGRELQAIAVAFDDFFERLDAFIARERAFTEDVSHELRTPLSVVTSAVQLLQGSSGLDAATRKRVDRLARAADQMQSVLDALLFLAREEAPDPAHRSCVRDIVLECVELMAPQTEAQKVQVRLVRMDECVVAAPDGITRCVVRNLLANALAHSQGGSVEVTLADGLLRIEDHGVGIEPEVMAHIFEHRVRGTHSTGQGIGLYLVRRICDRLGWEVSAHSERGCGACFEVRFHAGNGSERPEARGDCAQPDR